MRQAHTNHGLWRSKDDEAKTNKVTTVELEVTRLGALKVVSDETMNLGSED